jgi:predicted transcriptional regulator
MATAKTTEPTEKQQRVLEHLQAGLTHSEIAKELGIHQGGVASHVKALQRKGLLDADGKPVAESVAEPVKKVVKRTAPAKKPGMKRLRGKTKPVSTGNNVLAISSGGNLTVETNSNGHQWVSAEMEAKLSEESLMATVENLRDTAKTIDGAMARLENRSKEIDDEIARLTAEREENSATIRQLALQAESVIGALERLQVA